MKVLIIAFLLFLPMLTAFTSSFWFWRIKYINCLRTAKTLDNDTVTLTATGMTISELRRVNGNRVGDEVVVVHHLVELAEDAQNDIFKEGVVLTILNMVVLLFVALAITANTPKADRTAPTVPGTAVQASRNQEEAASAKSTGDQVSLIQDTWQQAKIVINQAVVMYGVPVSMLAFFVHSLLFTLSLREQARKYRSVLPGLQC